MVPEAETLSRMVLLVALTSVGAAASEGERVAAQVPTPTTTTRAVTAATIMCRLLKVGALRRTGFPFFERGRYPRHGHGPPVGWERPDRRLRKGVPQHRAWSVAAPGERVVKPPITCHTCNADVQCRRAVPPVRLMPTCNTALVGDATDRSLIHI